MFPAVAQLVWRKTGLCRDPALPRVLGEWCGGLTARAASCTQGGGWGMVGGGLGGQELPA